MIKAGSKPKRGTEGLAVADFNEFKLQVQSIRDRRLRALICTLFLTGRRISEIVGRDAKGIYPSVEPLRKKQLLLKKENIEGKDCWVLWFKNMPVLKKRKPMVDDFPAFCELPHQSWAVDIILDYVRILQDDDVLFDFKRGNAWYLINKYTDMFPHYFRHASATYDRLMNDYTVAELMTKMHWKDPKMALRYLHLEPKSLLERQIKAFRSQSERQTA